MRHLFQAYPGGVSGVGFLMLRTSAALLVISVGVGYSIGGATSLAFLIALAGALIIGIGTRVVAMMSAAIAVLTLPGGSWDTAMVHLALALACSAMVLIGPGAYSIDALRFGRKTIHVARRRTTNV